MRLRSRVLRLLLDPERGDVWIPNAVRNSLSAFSEHGVEQSIIETRGGVLSGVDHCGEVSMAQHKADNLSANIETSNRDLLLELLW
jgi:hypothetical protein